MFEFIRWGVLDKFFCFFLGATSHFDWLITKKLKKKENTETLDTPPK
jgi:hypothetical protein